MTDLKSNVNTNRRYGADNMNKSRDSSVESEKSLKPNGYYEIRDELARNPKRRHNKVEAYWLDDN